jgi:hypothetical protein
MKKFGIILIVVSFVVFSCSKDDDIFNEETETSFTMTYDGVTYTKAEANSLNLVGGAIAVKGTEDGGFGLTILGVGADGTTSTICDNCSQPCTVMLDFGAVEGKEGLVGLSGTLTRTGKEIEVNISGITTSLETKTLTATITVGMVI